MGNPSSEPATLINRSWVDVGLYRDEALRLGYRDELDSLVARWRELLRKAGQ